MFFKKKVRPTNGTASSKTAAGSIKAVLDTINESLEQKKQAMSAAQKLNKRLATLEGKMMFLAEQKNLQK